ncbi:MAG: type 2 isopentenyl-diphosphate Delta-isomerase [Pseudomonadota bacterium]
MAMTEIRARKDQHLDIVLSGAAAPAADASPFDAIRFVHEAAPDFDADAIDLSTPFLSFDLGAPLLISSMTGGPARATEINFALADAARHFRIPFCVGSQRIALETDAASGIGRELRTRVGEAPLFANIGAAQVALWSDPAQALKAVDMIAADALIVHFNPLQEALQPGGDTDWSNLTPALRALAKASPVPLIAKEVGSGISAATAERLSDVGFAAIDVAGTGGTSWAAVEAHRAEAPRDAEIAAPFRDWGIPTPVAIANIYAARPATPLIASGGIRDGLDAAKAIRLGASLVGQAAALLTPALEGSEAVIARIDILLAQLRIACFCTGARSLAALRAVPLQS